MGRHEGNDETVCRPHLDDDGGRKCCHDDVGSGRGQAHTEDQAGNGGDDHQGEDVPAGYELHDLGDDPADPHGHHADDDAGCRRGNGHGYHVAPPRHQRADDLREPLLYPRHHGLLPHIAPHGMLQDHDEEHDHDGPERRQFRGVPGHDQFVDQNGDGDEVVGTGLEHLEEAGHLGRCQPPEPELRCLDVCQEEQGGVGHEGRDRRRLDHRQVGHAQIFGDDECRRTHDGGGDLPVGAGCHLDGGRLDGRVAHFLHEGDGEGAGGDDVGDGRARHEPRQARTHDGCLGRPPLEPSQEGKGQLDEEPPRPGPLEHCAKENEEEDDHGRDIQGDPVDPLSGQGDLVDVLRQACALEGECLGHVLGEKDVEGKGGGDDR